MTIDTEEEKENSSAKPFIYYTVTSRFVYTLWIKSNRMNQNYLQRSHIQYNQTTTRDSLNFCSLFFVLFCFLFLLHNTSSSETNTDNIFLQDNHTASSTARYFWQQHTGQSRSEKKNVWPAQSQNNSWKQQWRTNSCMLMDDFQQDDSEGNGFSKKTCSETISCYTKFINSNCGAHNLRSRCKWGRGKGSERGRKMGLWGLDPRFFPRSLPFPAYACYAGYSAQGLLGEGGP